MSLRATKGSEAIPSRLLRRCTPRNDAFMLDVKFIRDNLTLVKKAADAKNRKVDVDKLLVLDNERKKIINEVEKLRAEKNKVSREIKNGNRQLGKDLRNKIRDLDEKLRAINEELKNLLLQIPNVFAQDVPIGKDENSN